MKKGLFTAFVLPTLMGMLVLGPSANAGNCQNVGSSYLSINNNTNQGLIYATSQASSGKKATTKSGFGKCPGQQTCIHAHKSATMQACAHTTCLNAGSHFIPITVGTIFFVTRGATTPTIFLSYKTSCAQKGTKTVLQGSAMLQGRSCTAKIVASGYVKYYCDWNG